jgi:hypothetical protein
MITDKWLISETENTGLGGKQRLYRFPSGYGLSMINFKLAHSYSFAWEGAVLRDMRENGKSGGLDYSTPMTSDVEVFMSDDEANAWIELAATTIGGVAVTETIVLPN